MKKHILHASGILVLMAALMACSSPEEKAADYIINGDNLFQDGELTKAEIEFKNALQVNQNLPDAWYGLARIYKSKQEWGKAHAVLSKVREMAPQHVDARIMLAQLLLVNNQLDEALSDATEIMEMAPNDARSHTLMAAVQFQLGNLEGAQLGSDKALTIDAGLPEALLVRAMVFIARKNYGEALSVLDKAIDADYENISFYVLKIQAYEEMEDRPAIEQVYLTLIEQFPDEVNYKRAIALHYLADENIDSAERFLQQIAESDTESVDGKVRFVAFKQQYRSPVEAIALVKSYIDSDKDEYRYRFLLGQLYVAEKQPDKAQEVYEGIVADDELQPNGLEARNKIALIETRAGNRDRAQTLVNEVLAQDKINENALLMQAGFQLSDGKTDDAIVSARTVLRDHPDSIKALALLGQAYDANGSRELAIESYTRAFQLSPGEPVIANKLAGYMLLQRKVALADEILRKSFSSGNQSVEAIKLYAQAKLSLGEWEEAELLAKQLQKVEGQEVVSLQLLGLAYLGQQQQEDSIEAFKRAYRLAPNEVQPVVALVQTYLQSGKPDEARRFLESILEVDSDNITAHMLMGELDLANGADSEAIRHFSAVIESDPDLVRGYRRLAVVYSGQKQMDKAKAVIREGMAAIPDSAILSIHLAAIYEKNGEFDEAIVIYQEMLEKDDSLVAKNNLANLLLDHRSDQASLDMARKIATELRDSQIPQLRDTYAWALVKSGYNFEEAVVILERIVKENDQVDAYAYHLGEAYRRKGDSENAIAYLQKAMDLADPDSDISRKAKESLQQMQ